MMRKTYHIQTSYNYLIRFNNIDNLNILMPAFHDGIVFSDQNFRSKFSTTNNGSDILSYSYMNKKDQ